MWQTLVAAQRAARKNQETKRRVAISGETWYNERNAYGEK
jgi:hypothetical protein